MNQGYVKAILFSKEVMEADTVDHQVEAMEEEISSQLDMEIMVNRAMAMEKEMKEIHVYKLVVQHAQLLYAVAVFVIC